MYPSSVSRSASRAVLHTDTRMCSASESTHTESGKLYRKVKHRPRPKVSSRQRPKRAPTKRRSPRRLRRRGPHTEHGLGVLSRKRKSWYNANVPLPCLSLGVPCRATAVATCLVRGILYIHPVSPVRRPGQCCIHTHPCLTPTFHIWPIKDSLSLVFVRARIKHPFITPAHLHYPHYCNTYARFLCNIWPPPDPPCWCHTPYNIGNDNIV